MSRYELLLFVHVLGAAAWYGAVLLSHVLLEIACRARDVDWVVRFGRYDDALAKLLYGPAGLLVLGAGIALVLDGPWSFREDGWVTAGLVLFLGALANGAAVIGRATARLTALVREGAPDEQVYAQLGRLRLLSWIDVALLTLAVFLMTTKPI